MGKPVMHITWILEEKQFCNTIYLDKKIFKTIQKNSSGNLNLITIPIVLLHINTKNFVESLTTLFAQNLS